MKLHIQTGYLNGSGDSHTFQVFLFETYFSRLPQDTQCFESACRIGIKTEAESNLRLNKIYCRHIKSTPQNKRKACQAMLVDVNIPRRSLGGIVVPGKV